MIIEELDFEVEKPPKKRGRGRPSKANEWSTGNGWIALPIGPTKFELECRRLNLDPDADIEQLVASKELCRWIGKHLNNRFVREDLLKRLKLEPYFGCSLS